MEPLATTVASLSILGAPLAHANKAQGATKGDMSVTSSTIGRVSPALDNGVKPAEISEIITHLAFYSGWANGMSAAAAVKNVFSALPVAKGVFARPSAQGAAQNFTGSITVDPLYAPNANTTSSGGHVAFEPGARSAWHTHPAGQILIITTGTGWVQKESDQKREIKPGDVIWTPPGVKHWHGTTATTDMGHIAITNMIDGKNVHWLEHVTDERYRK